MNKKSYYEVLGLSENASEAEIKAAYRKLALKWHPDKFATKSQKEREEANQKMKEVNQAYEVLSDPEKRKNYDRYGSEEAFRSGADSGGFGQDSSFFQDIFDKH